MLAIAKAAIKTVERTQAELDRLPQMRKDAIEMRDSIPRMKKPESREAQERWVVSHTKLMGCDDAEKKLNKDLADAVEQCALLYPRLGNWWNAHVAGLRGEMFRATREAAKATITGAERELDEAAMRALEGSEAFFKLERAFWDTTAGFRGEASVHSNLRFGPEVENLRMLVNHCESKKKLLGITEEMLSAPPAPGIPDRDAAARLAEFQHENDTVVVRLTEDVGAPDGSEWEAYLPRPLPSVTSRKARMIPQGTVLVMTRRNFKALARCLERLEGDAPPGARIPYVASRLSPALAAVADSNELLKARGEL